MNHRTAVIGAGLSGLAAAFRLAEAGHEVRVFEKSRGLSGRAASRSREGCRYDLGANYFTISSNEMARLVFQTLPTEGLTRIVGGILPFDRGGRILPGDGDRPHGSRWTYRDGISTLGKLLAARGGYPVENGVRLTRLERAGTRWRLEAEGGPIPGEFDAVLLTPPAPQTADLLEASLPDGLGGLDGEGLVAALRGAEYFRQFSVVLNFEGEFTLPGDAYALINTDRGHDLAWVARENGKAGRVPGGQTLFIVQMAPDWSSHHYDDAPATIVAEAVDGLGSLLGEALPSPVWSDLQRWRYAHPRGAINLEALRSAAPSGLYFAGDALVGRGRVAGAIETGFSAATAILGQGAHR